MLRPARGASSTISVPTLSRKMGCGQFIYVLKGWAIFDYEGYGEHRLVAGSTVYQPPGISHREIDHSEDFEVLEITLPADFETKEVK
jgi:quercetin dioxygenase-like cupin family protein